MSKSLLEEFSNLGKDTKFKFTISNESSILYEPLTNDALFHIPMIAMAILVLVKSSSKELSTGEIGRHVGILLEETISGFKGSSQILGWSATLGHRTADAVVFLEQITFIEVTKNRALKITDAGNKFILQIRKEKTDISQAVRGFFRNSNECFNLAEQLL